jgi:hypothetical protein
MKAKEFVQQKYPNAKCTKHTSGIKYVNQKTWFLIINGEKGKRLSEGTSESNAWKNAKLDIIESENDDKANKEIK